MAWGRGLLKRPPKALNDPEIKFLLALADHLHQPITTLLEQMTSSELLLWQRRYQTGEMLGAAREDLRAAQISSTIANYAGRCLPEGEFRTILSFLLYGELEEAEVDQDTLATKLQIMAARINAAYANNTQPALPSPEPTPEISTAKIQNQPEVEDGACSRNGDPVCG